MFKLMNVKYLDVVPFSFLGLYDSKGPFSYIKVKCEKCGCIFTYSYCDNDELMHIHCRRCSNRANVFYSLCATNKFDIIDDIHTVKFFGNKEYIDMVVYECSANTKSKTVQSTPYCAYKINKKTGEYLSYVFENDQWYDAVSVVKIEGREYTIATNIKNCFISSVKFSPYFYFKNNEYLRKTLGEYPYSFYFATSTTNFLLEYLSLIFAKPECYHWFEEYGPSFRKTLAEDWNNKNRIFDFDMEADNIRDFLKVPTETPKGCLFLSFNRLKMLRYLKQFNGLTLKEIEWFCNISEGLNDTELLNNLSITPNEIFAYLNTLSTVAHEHPFKLGERWQKHLAAFGSSGVPLSMVQKFPPSLS